MCDCGKASSDIIAKILALQIIQCVKLGEKKAETRKHI